MEVATQAVPLLQLVATQAVLLLVEDIREVLRLRDKEDIQEVLHLRDKEDIKGVSGLRVKKDIQEQEPHQDKVDTRELEHRAERLKVDIQDSPMEMLLQEVIV